MQEVCSTISGFNIIWIRSRALWILACETGIICVVKCSCHSYQHKPAVASLFVSFHFRCANEWIKKGCMCTFMYVSWERAQTCMLRRLHSLSEETHLSQVTFICLPQCNGCEKLEFISTATATDTFTMPVSALEKPRSPIKLRVPNSSGLWNKQPEWEDVISHRCSAAITTLISNPLKNWTGSMLE